MTEKELRTGLLHVDSASLKRMYRAWSRDRNPGAKDECVAKLERILSDPGQVGPVARTWPLPARRAIGVIRARGGAPLRTLEAACAAAGVEAAPAVCRELLTQGVLLVVRPEGSKLSPERLGPGSLLWAALVPGAAEGEEVPLESLRLPPVRDDEVRAVLSGDASSLPRAVSRLLGLFGRRSLRLNQDGWPGLPLLAAVRKELGGDALFPLLLATDTGLLADTPAGLRPDGDALARLSTNGLAAGLFAAFLDQGRWRDPPGATDEGETLHALRSGWGAPRLHDHAEVRLVLAGALRRLENEGWVEVDALVSHVLTLVPDLGWRCTPSGYSSYRDDTPDSASDLRLQRAICADALTWTFRAFGLVDVGSRAPTVELPPRPGYDRALDEAHDNAGWRALTGREKAKPRWRPDPSPLVVRLTAEGRQILHPTRVRASAPRGRVHVGADFEVVVPVGADPQLQVGLDRVAVAHRAGPGDPVGRWRLDRDAWLVAMDGGFDALGLLADLERASGGPIPENVRTTLRAWSAQFGTTRLYEGFDYVELADGPARDALVAPSAPGAEADGLPVGTTCALVPQGTLKGQVVDYGAPPRAVLAVTLYGIVQVGPDLLLDHRLDRVATRAAPRQWSWSREKVAARGGSVVIEELASRAAGGIPAGVRARLRAWSGELGPARVGRVELLQVAEAEGLASLPEVAPMILGVLPPDHLVVRDGQRRALLRALAALGVRVEEGLVFNPPDP